MAKVIAITNRKGGCGKSFTTANLGFGLARKGKKVFISPHQLSYVTHSNPGEGLLIYGGIIIPFIDRFPKDSGEIYSLLTSKPLEMQEAVTK